MELTNHPKDCLHFRREARGSLETCKDCGKEFVRVRIQAVTAITYVPKPLPIDAIKWNKEGDHPLVKQIEVDEPAVHFEWALVQPDHDPIEISPGDYVVGPDEADNYHVFEGRNFENQYEPQILRQDAKRFMPTNYHINMLSMIAAWCKRASTEIWAVQMKQAGELQQMSQFCDRLGREMEKLK